MGTVTTVFLQYATGKQRLVDVGIAEGLTSQISSELGNAAGIMSSVTSVQQVLDDPYGDQLDSFAARSIDSSSLIKSLARYERVESSDLAEFAQNMSESGMYNFSISSISTDGKKVPVQASNAYYPIIWRQPFNPVSAAMIGVDISTNSNIFRSIQGSETSNSIQISALPEGWNVGQGSDLLLIKPTYFGRYSPNDTVDIASQSNGGVVMGIGLSEYIKSDLSHPGYDISVWLKNTPDNQNSNKVLVHKVTGESEGDVYFKGLFKGVDKSSSPLTGKNSLRISVKSHGGISQKILIQAALIALTMSTVLLVLFSLCSNIRKRDALHSRERESALITLKAIGDAVITTDGENVVTYVNPSAEILLGSTNDQLIGNSVYDTVYFVVDATDKTNDDTHCSFLQAMSADKVVTLPTLELRAGSQSEVFVSSTISPLGSGDVAQQEKGHVLVMRDITAEREMTRELSHMATHDSLTGIANRFHFENELKKLIRSSLSCGEEHSICYIDLDQFKTINDTCGHSAGDKLLVRVTEGLSSVIRTNDVLARLGGDEFGLLIKHCGEEEAVVMANRVYDFFQTLYFQHDQDVFAVRASIGFVHITQQFNDIENVMAAADLACYSAKDRGRNHLYIFNHYEDETSDRMSEMMWLPKLQMALRSDNFRLFVQPIIDIEIEGSQPCAPFNHYEILLRLVLDDGSLIAPAQLIVAAERYNLMRDIDRWVVLNAIKLISELKTQMGEQLPKFSINISGQTTVDAEFPDFISEQLSKADIDPATLVFEITETSAITNMQSAVSLVDFLHDVGCKLALDDFGSGVSSFGYLKSLPVDYIKIDGQFIKNITTNEVDREMVKCMQAVASILGIEIVAEFVENEDIVDVLRDLNIGYAQGYHYGKPHPFEDLLNYAQERKAA